VTPQQGWKIHISARPQNAKGILERVTDVLFKRCYANFKFALDMTILFFLNGKNWSRGNSGKFITVYPPNNDAFLEVIEQLSQATQGFQGPYILSDRRYGRSGTVFFRYGGMRSFDVLSVEGERVPMLIAPDGRHVPDERGAFPRTPNWEKELLPAEDPEPAHSDSNYLNHGRYKVIKALSFSNAGGVYLAFDHRTGSSVVIKEARPHVNSTSDGFDATDLLKKEFRLLTLLQDTGMVPRPVELFQEWEHFFLVEEYIEGTTMAVHSAQNNVLMRTRPSRKDYETWYETVRSLALALLRIIETLHRRGIVFADLSTNNLLISVPTGELKLIDFEGAYEFGVDRPSAIFTPGFESEVLRAGAAPTKEDDLYAIGAVLMSYLFPVTALFHINPNAKLEMMDAIQRDALLPRQVGDLILQLLSAEAELRPAPKQAAAVLSAHPGIEDAIQPVSGEPDHSDTPSRIVAEIEASATYLRMDRLFPAHPKVFATNPLSLAYGAAGVGYTLTRITGKAQAQIADWILGHRIDATSYPPGLYIGMSGIAWCLLEMGETKNAEEMLRGTFDHPLLSRSHDIFYGTAGWGMTCLRFFVATGNEAYLESAKRAGYSLLNTGSESASGCFWPGSGSLQLGFAHGASGIALFLLYLYLATGEEGFLTKGEAALSFDLSFAVETKDGGLSWPASVDAPNILLPYWRMGSAGIGRVVLRYFRLLAEKKYEDILERIFLDTDRKYAVLPGLFSGLAGLGSFLLDMHEWTGEERFRRAAAKVAEGIWPFRVERRGIAFPGDGLDRLSCDFGTGSAGIALFFNRLLGRQGSDFMLDAYFDAKRELCRDQSDKRVLQHQRG
jgi:serine/threonine protein kinase